MPAAEGLQDFSFAFLSILLEGAPFILVGTILSGFIDVYLPPRAMERLPAVRAAYDVALSRVDALVMPTTITTASRLPEDLADPLAVTEAAFAPLRNTSPFNSTHHPALSVPCGTVDGLPVGMMLVGRHWDEATLYCLANAFEQSTDWRSA